MFVNMVAHEKEYSVASISVRHSIINVILEPILFFFNKMHVFIPLEMALSIATATSP